jgi:hypothetical protein
MSKVSHLPMLLPYRLDKYIFHNYLNATFLLQIAFAYLPTQIGCTYTCKWHMKEFDSPIVYLKFTILLKFSTSLNKSHHVWAMS